MTESDQAVSVDQQDDVLVLTILVPQIRQPEVADQVSRELNAAIKDKSSPKVVVDMAKVEFMSSVAYLPFVGLRSKVMAAGGSLVLCNFAEMIKEMFEAARLLVNPRSPSAPFQFADSIDAAIAAAVDNYAPNRIDAVDRAILRLATAELLHNPEVPDRVAVNEAIELARTFGTTDSARFVNGVLDRIATELGKA